MSSEGSAEGANICNTNEDELSEEQKGGGGEFNSFDSSFASSDEGFSQT